MKYLALALLLFSTVSCAAGDNDPGPTRDNCRLRDCGVAVGGQEAEPEEDEGVPDEDTASLRDSAVGDTRDVGADSACTPPSGAACALYPQCGCSSGLNCDVPAANFADGRTACVTAGTKSLHHKCTTTGECARGLTCYYDVCLPFCATSGDCAGACNDVKYIDGSVEKTVPGMRVCMAACDPLNPSKVCGASTTCLFPSPTATTCAAAGLSTTAASCASNPFACAPGYVCVGSGDCKRWCRIGLAGDCPGAKPCNRLATAPSIGSIEYGVCAY